MLSIYSLEESEERCIAECLPVDAGRDAGDLVIFWPALALAVAQSAVSDRTSVGQVASVCVSVYAI